MLITELVENGNANVFATDGGGGWVVGYGAAHFKNPTLRSMAEGALAHTIGVKWMAHEKGDPKGKNKPLSKECTISILTNDGGDFDLEFSLEGDEFNNKAEGVYIKHKLSYVGDYVIWGKGVYHQWAVNAPSTIVTMRWTPKEQDA